MIYIYNCYGGTHSSSLASAVHLNKLPSDRIPTKKEIIETEYFDKLNSKDMGKIIFRGVDEEGNKVFSLGRGTSKVLIPCLENLLKLLYSENKLSEKIVFSNMSPTVPPLMTAGGVFSRGLRIHCIGVPLLVAGARQTYKKVVQIVKNTKEMGKNIEGPVLVLYNKT